MKNIAEIMKRTIETNSKADIEMYSVKELSLKIKEEQEKCITET